MTQQEPILKAYTVRVSPRARRASLRMTVDRGLEVVVPPGFPLARVPGLVADKAAWIERVTRRFEVERAAAEAAASAGDGADGADGLPRCIELEALAERWKVEYRSTPSTQVRVGEWVRPAAAESGWAGGDGSEWARLTSFSPAAGSANDGIDGALTVSGAVGDHHACRAALVRWLSRKAAGHLVPLVAGVAREEGLAYSGVTVRGQRTRWGSCSRRGTISLNRHLLFLPPPLVRYVVLHELCHTVKLDHSARFWEEVRRREPEAERLRRDLRLAGRWVPRWAGSPRR